MSCFNVEEEDVVILNGWTPKKKKKTLSSNSIILGDLNVHFDIPTNPLVL